ncbi:MAG: putative amidohydrolase YtcJ [Halioglobus sp.]|jgi:predicted amidohydrolase YtcJ
MRKIKILVRAASVLMLLCLASCVSNTGRGVDSIFFNARAYTLDSATPWAEAVAVKDDKIVYVGDNAGALALAGSVTQTHDLQGSMLLPGFIDTHMHPVSGGGYARALSLDTFGTVEEWVESIKDYAVANTDKPLIFGYGFLGTTFGAQGPTASMIDAVVPDRPVLIMDEGFHGAWANSKALEALNITKDTPDLAPGFSYYKRDEQGNPTGYLLEDTAVMAMDALNVINADVQVDGTAYVIETLNRYGVTSVFDAGAIGDSAELQTVLNRIEDAGDMTVRIVGSYFVGAPGDAEHAVENANKWRETMKGDNYHYRMLKIMLDGTVEGRTAAMFEDYQGEPGNSGETIFTEKQMIHMISGAAAEHIDVHVHALGERAVHETLNAIEVARQSHPDSSTRYTICHIQVLTDEDIPRFAELDVIAQSTPLWASYDTFGEPFVSEGQFNRYWRFKSLHDEGVKLTFGSDFPASGAGMLGMSPVLQMEIGHTRQNPGEPDAKIQPSESERLDIDTLIRGYTLDAAYQLHMEDELGSLTVGKKADLVVLDKNLFETERYEIHKVKVLMTMMNGNVVYEAGL